MADYSFCTRIALFSFICYLAGTLTAYVLDPRLKTHVRYPHRTYKYGWIWILLSPVLPFSTYFLLRHLESSWAILIGSWALLLVFGGAASLGFPPERPHVGIFGYTFGGMLLSFLTAALHVNRGLLDFTQNTGVPFEARLESVKATVLTWQMILVYGFVGYLAFVISWVYVLSVIADLTVNSKRDKFALGRAAIFQICAVSICVIFGPLFEAYSNAHAAVALLLDIRK